MNISALTKQVLLIIMDGMGSNPNDLKNAVLHAKTPNLDSYKKDFPYLEMHASGELVGLPKGVMGNSEVGHLNLGAGRSIRQDLVRINEAIELGSLTQMQELQSLVTKTKEAGGRIHLMGLLSDGGVHSHIDHIKALVKSLKELDSSQIFLHAFMDGRDTQKENGKKYLTDLLALEEQELFTLASIQGRSIAIPVCDAWGLDWGAYTPPGSRPHFLCTYLCVARRDGYQAYL